VTATSEQIDQHDQATGPTGLYVYGIVEDRAGRVPDGLAGVEDARVELLPHDGVAAVVGRIHVERPPGRRADLMAHSRVVEALDDRGPVVPVQFGSVLADEDSVIGDLLEPDAEQWRGLLKALTDRRQFNLRCTYNEAAVLQEVMTEDPEVAALSARTRALPEDVTYAERVRLGERVARGVEGKRAQDSALVLDLVLPHAVSYSLRDRGGVDHLLDVAFLVGDDRRAAFEDALEQLAEAMHERARFQLVGPVPPYDFVDGDWWV